MRVTFQAVKKTVKYSRYNKKLPHIKLIEPARVKKVLLGDLEFFRSLKTEWILKWSSNTDHGFVANS